MTKKIFLSFTLLMVLISGTTCYAMMSRAEKILSERKQKKIHVKPQELSVLPSVYESTPMQNRASPPTPAPSTISHTQYNPVPAQGLPTLTNGQKYIKNLTAENDKSVLLIGMDPLYGNFDTLIILTMNEKEKTVAVIDLPRDIFLDYTDDILEKLKNHAEDFYRQKGNRKINAAAMVGKRIDYCPEKEKFENNPGINFLCDVIEEIFEIRIADYLAVETAGFRELVDYFGGVEIDVPIYMHYEDPVQDLYIHLEPGLQRLNGIEAEGFVRFRQGYTPDGDMILYPRSENTLLFLNAFFEQHITLKNLLSAGKIADIVRKNARTSVNHTEKLYPYILLVKNMLTDKYLIRTIDIECEDTKHMNGAMYDILKTRH